MSKQSAAATVYPTFVGQRRESLWDLKVDESTTAQKATTSAYPTFVGQRREDLRTTTVHESATKAKHTLSAGSSTKNVVIEDDNDKVVNDDDDAKAAQASRDRVERLRKSAAKVEAATVTAAAEAAAKASASRVYPTHIPRKESIYSTPASAPAAAPTPTSAATTTTPTTSMPPRSDATTTPGKRKRGEDEGVKPSENSQHSGSDSDESKRYRHARYHKTSTSTSETTTTTTTSSTTTRVEAKKTTTTTKTEPPGKKQKLVSDASTVAAPKDGDYPLFSSKKFADPALKAWTQEERDKKIKLAAADFLREFGPFAMPDFDFTKCQVRNYRSKLVRAMQFMSHPDKGLMRAVTPYQKAVCETCWLCLIDTRTHAISLGDFLKSAMPTDV